MVVLDEDPPEPKVPDVQSISLEATRYRVVYKKVTFWGKKYGKKTVSERPQKWLKQISSSSCFDLTCPKTWKQVVLGVRTWNRHVTDRWATNLNQVAVRRQPNTKSEAIRQLPQGECLGGVGFFDDFLPLMNLEANRFYVVISELTSVDPAPGIRDISYHQLYCSKQYTAFVGVCWTAIEDREALPGYLQ